MKRLQRLLCTVLTGILSVSSNTVIAASSDNPLDNPYAQHLWYMQERGFVEFFSPWSTSPNAIVTRGEFLQLVTTHIYPVDVLNHCLQDIGPSPDSAYTLLFTDVPRTDPTAMYVCVGMQSGLIQGYADGSFRANQPMNLAEASKILVKAYGLAPLGETPLPGTPWYAHYLWDLKNRGGVPPALENRPSHLLRRSDVAEILHGLRTWDEQLIPML